MIEPEYWAIVKTNENSPMNGIEIHRTDAGAAHDLWRDRCIRCEDHEMQAIFTAMLKHYAKNNSRRQFLGMIVNAMR